MIVTMPDSAHIDEATQARIYRWAYRVLGNHHDSLDATQDVMIKWLRRAPDDVRHPDAWLRRLTINHCLDVLRKQSPQALGEGLPERVDPNRPGEAAEQAEHRTSITAALTQLSDMQRAVLTAKVYDGETFAEIAEGLGISVSSVKTHYLRGLQAMRRALAPGA